MPERGGVVEDENGVSRLVRRAFVNATGTGDVQVVAAQGAGNKIRVLAFGLKSGGLATTVKFKTSGNPISADYALALNDDFVLPHNPHGWFETSANEALNLNVSAVTTVGVQVTYIVVT